MKIKDWLVFIGLGLAWGSSFLWIKIALEEIGPFLLVALRILFAVLGLTIVVWIKKPSIPQRERWWVPLLVLGVTNTALPFILISWGELYIDSAIAAILNSSTPLFTIVIAHLFLTDDRITSQKLLSLVIGFLGVILLLIRDIDGEIRSSILGQGAVLIASLLYGGSAVYARLKNADIPGELQAFIPPILADSIMWIVTPFVEAPLRLPQNALTWVAVAWLGLVGSCIAYLMFFYLLHEIGPTRTTLVTYVFPLVGVALGVIFLKEHLDWNLLFGGGLIVGSIILVNRRP